MDFIYEVIGRSEYDGSESIGLYSTRAWAELVVENCQIDHPGMVFEIVEIQVKD